MSWANDIAIANELERLRAEVERLKEEVALACVLRDQHITKSNALHKQNEHLRGENERLMAERDEARVAWADWQKSSEAYRADVARLRREIGETAETKWESQSKP